MVSTSIVGAKSEKASQIRARKSNGPTNDVISGKGVEPESRGPNEQEGVNVEETSTQQERNGTSKDCHPDNLFDDVESEGRGQNGNELDAIQGEGATSQSENKADGDDDSDSLFDFSSLSPGGGRGKNSNLTTDELRANVDRIMSHRFEKSPSPTRKNFVSELLSDGSDDDLLDGDLSVGSTTDEGSILPDDHSVRADMIENMLAGIARPAPLSKENLEKSGVLHYESPTGAIISISHAPSVPSDDASACIGTKEFTEWVGLSSKKYGAKRISVLKLKILEVEKDKDGTIESMKIKVECKLRDEEARRSYKDVSETFYLRRESYSLLVSLICVDDNSQWSLLVDRPCVPLGRPSALELPTVGIDEEKSTYTGVVIKLMNDLCGIDTSEYDLVNLTEETYAESSSSLGQTIKGLTPAPTVTNESVKFLHLAKRVTQKELQHIRKNLSEAREYGTEEDLSLRVIPTSEIWKVSTDMKVMCALFLLEKRYSISFTPRRNFLSRNNSFGGGTPFNRNGNKAEALERTISEVKEKVISVFTDAKKSW